MEGMGEYVCEKPCNKMKSCGRHRCTGRCCVVRITRISSSPFVSSAKLSLSM